MATRETEVLEEEGTPATKKGKRPRSEESTRLGTIKFRCKDFKRVLQEANKRRGNKIGKYTHLQDFLGVYLSTSGVIKKNPF